MLWLLSPFPWWYYKFVTKDYETYHSIHSILAQKPLDLPPNTLKVKQESIVAK